MGIICRAGIFSVLLASIGCSGSDVKKVTLKGKLVEGTRPFVVDSGKLKLPAGASLPPGTRPLQIAFLPVSKGDTTFAQVNAEDGTFTVTLPEGKYKIAVTVSAGGGSPDFFGGRYAQDKTQIERDLKEGDEIVIDVTKPAG